MSDFEKWSLVLQACVAVTAFATLAFLYRQVRAMVDQIVATQEASRAQSVMEVVNFLQSNEARTSREYVRSILSTKHHSSWSEDEKRHAAAVCANYDVAAGLLKSGVAPKEIIIANWAPSIVHCHQVLSPYISTLRTGPGAHASYWCNSDWLRSQIDA